ncbi:MAG: AAA family ATPase [Candidatus Micrarchaeota archaeon]|nr:AAA family ATPase [Candidatus Micrarchaeota archaeon]
MIIVIEGIDGSAKSSISKRLAARIGALRITTPTEDDKTLHADMLEELSAHMERTVDRARFYLEMNRSAYVHDKGYVDSCTASAERHVIFVRSAISTLVTHLAMDAMLSGGVHADEIKCLVRDKEGLPSPDIVVFLNVDEKERLKRIGRRHNNQMDMDTKYIDLTREGFAKEAQRERKLGRGVIEVNTTMMSEREAQEFVDSRIIDAIRRHRRNVES